MKPPVSIRPAVPGDLAALLAVEQASFGADAFSRRQMRYLMTRAKGAFFIALRQGVPAGYISVLASARHRHGRIYSLAVDAAFRGQGVAEALLDRALDFARARSLRSVFLEVRPENKAAAALYGKKGFVKRAVIPDYYHDGGSADSMVLLFTRP